MNIRKNKAEFLKLCKQIKRDGIEDLIKFLENTDFFGAPASTRFHLSVEGGLCQHSLNVYNALLMSKFVKGYSPETLAICGLFHDICKVNFYKQSYRNKKVYSEDGSRKDKLGKYDWKQVSCYEVDNKFPYGHGEKSVYLINNYMKLSFDELLAIRWHMGAFDTSVKGGSYDLNSAFENCSLAVELHIADLRATYLMETKEGNK